LGVVCPRTNLAASVVEEAAATTPPASISTMSARLAVTRVCLVLPAIYLAFYSFASRSTYILSIDQISGTFALSIAWVSTFSGLTLLHSKPVPSDSFSSLVVCPLLVVSTEKLLQLILFDCQAWVCQVSSNLLPTHSADLWE
jgi:hypothetical protein